MQETSNFFSRIDKLLDYLKIESIENADFNPKFPMRVPLAYAEKMEKGNSNDPLLMQVLPTQEEKKQVPGFSDDPVGDKKSETESGILHKYQGRILLIATGNCSVRCRFCFRRNASFKTLPDMPVLLRKTLERSPEIHEVIFSGGDPLTAPITFLEKTFESIVPARAVRTIRFHSRVPLTEPEEAFRYLPLFKKYANRFKFVLVLHTNHPRELSGKTPGFLKECRENGIHLLNQSVLLKGINDSSETLAELSHSLFDCGVFPYYLHLLDRANGTAHFEVQEETAKKIHQQLLEKLPGYLVPKLVREICGEKSKTPIF